MQLSFECTRWLDRAEVLRARVIRAVQWTLYYRAMYRWLREEVRLELNARQAAEIQSDVLIEQAVLAERDRCIKLIIAQPGFNKSAMYVLLGRISLGEKPMPTDKAAQ